MSLASGGSTGLKHKIDQYRERRAARIAARFDEEPDSWITVNGNHIPLDENGRAIGGQPKALGKKMSVEEADNVIRNYNMNVTEYNQTIRSLKSDIEELEFDLKFIDEEFDWYTEEEKKSRIEEINRELSNNKKELDSVEQKYNEYREAVFTKFPSYDDCKSSDDVSMRTEAVLNGKGKIGLKECDVESARMVGKSVEDYCNKVPELRDNIRAIVSVDMDGSFYGAADGWRTVQLNSKYFKNFNYLRKKYKNCTDCGYHPEGTTEKAIVYHELSHVLEYFADEKRERGKYFSSIIFDKVSKNLGLNVDECLSAVSDYAKSPKGHGRYSEWFAEAYAEYLSSDSPRKVAKEVGKVVDQELRKRGIRK